MQQHQFLFAEPHQIVIQPHLASTESVGTVSNSVPVHSENQHPPFDDFKQKNKHKSRSEPSPVEPDGKHPDPDHQIDEYA